VLLVECYVVIKAVTQRIQISEAAREAVAWRYPSICN